MPLMNIDRVLTLQLHTWHRRRVESWRRIQGPRSEPTTADWRHAFNTSSSLRAGATYPERSVYAQTTGKGLINVHNHCALAISLTRSHECCFRMLAMVSTAARREINQLTSKGHGTVPPKRNYVQSCSSSMRLTYSIRTFFVNLVYHGEMNTGQH